MTNNRLRLHLQQVQTDISSAKFTYEHSQLIGTAVQSSYEQTLAQLFCENHLTNLSAKLTQPSCKVCTWNSEWNMLQNHNSHSRIQLHSQTVCITSNHPTLKPTNFHTTFACLNSWLPIAGLALNFLSETWSSQLEISQSRPKLLPKFSSHFSHSLLWFQMADQTFDKKNYDRL